MVKSKNKTKLKKRTHLNIPKRIIYFSFGIFIASVLLMYSFQWNLLPFQITAMGIDITPYALSFFLVLIGVYASSLIKSGLKGNRELDV